MKKIITAKAAGNLLLFIFALLFVFHLLVLGHVIPTDLIWGGRISSPEAILRLEIWAIALTVVCALIVALKLGYLKWIKNQKAITVGVWVLFIYFSLNTVGNLLSANPIERYVFGGISLLAALLALRLAVEP